MRRAVLLLAAVAGLALVAATGVPAQSFPAVIRLPNGWQPEGIAVGKGTTFYAGSLATGAVYRGDLRTGKGRVLVPGRAGRIAVGLKHDRGRLFVAGGSTGKAFVYDAHTGRLVRELRLGGGDSFVNDVVVTNRAAYFTDSFRDVLYRLPLRASGAPAASARTIPLTGDFRLVSGQFNLNGIAAAPGGELIAVQSTTGELFRIDPQTGATREIELRVGDAANGDGLVLRGRTLYVVQNSSNRIAVIRLSPDLARGTFVRHIGSPRFDVPTTAALHGDRLYAVNARFGAPSTASTAYHVVRVPAGR
jgi:sugar lactone lactonase YvrE